VYSVRGKEAAYDIQGGNDKRWNRKIFFHQKSGNNEY
jgi:hypothetical protein